MVNRYIIFEVENPLDSFQIFDANNENELWGKWADIRCEEILFRKHVEAMAVNAGLLQKFCRDEKGYLFNSESADERGLREDLGLLSDEEYMDYLKKCVARNVHNYFALAPDFGELFLRRWEDDSAILPHEMYKYCFLKEYRNVEEHYAGEIFICQVCTI